ncbi:MAG: hypothetical protein KDD40_08110, partial [Bdellovibrionales bacterium]|nr:hypothetical protein [Bdellovibrionales bacterium]
NRYQYHIYAMVDGLYEALMGKGKDSPKTKQDVDPEAMQLMGNMMKYMVNESDEPTEWAGYFMQGLANSVLVHSEVPLKDGKTQNFCKLQAWEIPDLDNPKYQPSKHQLFYCMLRRMMDKVPTFKKFQPEPDVDSVAPRDYLNYKPIMPPGMYYFQ